jgi:hypothetical protein
VNFDPHQTAMHNIVAAMRFPGPRYYEVLEWLHQELRPATYVEIGVFEGDSLRLAMPQTRALGIDPSPRLKDDWRTETRIVRLTSSEFFARHTLREFFGADHFSLAFVDGLHQFEQVIEDLSNLERFSGPDSLIAVHDTMPLDEKTAEPTRRTQFHTGDVWKVIPFLKECRPDLELITVRAGPSGLTLIRRLERSHTRFKAEPETLARFRDLRWEYFRRHRDDFLETIPNERDAVVNWLRNGIYDQYHHSGA